MNGQTVFFAFLAGLLFAFACGFLVDGINPDILKGTPAGYVPVLFGGAIFLAILAVAAK